MIIRLSNVTKDYRVATDHAPGLKNILLHLPRYIRGALNREEFRALCDRWQTEDAIERELRRELERGADRRPLGEMPPGEPPAELVRAYPVWYGLAGVVLVIGAIVAIVGVVRAVRRR